MNIAFAAVITAAVLGSASAYAGGHGPAPTQKDFDRMQSTADRYHAAAAAVAGSDPALAQKIENQANFIDRAIATVHQQCGC